MARENEGPGIVRAITGAVKDALGTQGNDNGLLARWRSLGAAVSDPELSRGDAAVLWHIADRIGADGKAWPGYGRIAKDAGLHRSTVARSIVRLVKGGYLIRVSGGPGLSNRYRLGSRSAATSRADATSRKDATGVVAATRLGVVAPTRPEPASLNLLKEPTQERGRKRPALTLPAWIPADQWEAWKRHRKGKVTDESAKRAIAKLEALRAEGHDPVKVIDLAIESGWASFNGRDSTKVNGKPTAGLLPRDSRTQEEIDVANEKELARFGLGGSTCNA